MLYVLSDPHPRVSGMNLPALTAFIWVGLAGVAPCTFAVVARYTGAVARGFLGCVRGTHSTGG